MSDSWTRGMAAMLLVGLWLPVRVAAAARDDRRASAGEYAADHVVLKFAAGAGTAMIAATGEDVRPLAACLGLPAGAELQESGLRRWRRLWQSARVSSAGVADETAGGDFYYVTVPSGRTPDSMVASLRTNRLVAWVEKDPIGTGGAVPQSTLYGLQWHLGTNSVRYPGRIRAPEAWDITTGTSSTIVAVLDTGCDTDLLEFSGRTVPGWDFVNNDADPADDSGHGTAVSAVLCAGPTAMVAGVDWNCRLMPVKVLDANATGSGSWWAQGVDWAVANGAKVINLSAGSSESSTPLQTAITNAIAHGVIFVTIAHNDGGAIRFPGSLSECITVGGADSNGVRCGFSNFGSSLDIVAPATNIYTVVTNGLPKPWSGTSMAAPMVAGAAALLCAVRPELRQNGVASLLYAGADDRAGDALDTKGRDDYYGWGRLNVCNALVLAMTRVSSIGRTNGSSVRVQWAGSSNAQDRTPYAIAYAASATSLWTRIETPTNLSYQGGEAIWIDDGSETGVHPAARPARVYRIEVRPQ